MSLSIAGSHAQPHPALLHFASRLIPSTLMKDDTGDLARRRSRERDLRVGHAQKELVLRLREQRGLRLACGLRLQPTILERDCYRQLRRQLVLADIIP